MDVHSLYWAHIDSVGKGHFLVSMVSCNHEEGVLEQIPRLAVNVCLKFSKYQVLWRWVLMGKIG